MPSIAGKFSGVATKGDLYKMAEIHKEAWDSQWDATLWQGNLHNMAAADF